MRRQSQGLFRDFDDRMEDFKMPVGEPFDRLEKSLEILTRAESTVSEIRLLQEDLKEIWAEAKEYDLDVDVIKLVMKRRTKTKHENDEFDFKVSELELKLEEEGDDYGEKNRFPHYTLADVGNAFRHPLVWYFLIMAAFIAFGLCGCTTAPPRYEIVGVTGTRYAAVFKDGMPLAPGSYMVALTSPTTADVLVRGRKVGSGTVRTVSGKPDAIRIEITPGTTQVVVQ